jgi:hypothetical protein
VAGRRHAAKPEIGGARQNGGEQCVQVLATLSRAQVGEGGCKVNGVPRPFFCLDARYAR